MKTNNNNNNIKVNILFRFKRLCTYVIGVVIFLMQPCETTLKVYLNHTSVTLQNGSNIIDGFSFSFQTCTHGELLKELNNNMTITVIDGSRSKHSFLRLSWNDGNIIQTLDLAQIFSIDSNVIMKVELSMQQNISIFSITNMDLSPPKIYSISTTRLKNVRLTDRFRLGSDSFSGCFDSGENINIDKFVNTCPLDHLKSCNSTKCPDGFTGRYCDINRNECALNKCFSYSTCVDLVNGFRCICGKQWEGELCDKFKGDLCVNNPCKNNGLCTLIDGKNNYTCTCRTNYIGRNCEQDINPCSNSPCRNGGICSPQVNSNLPNCTCLEGFRGIHCELKEDPCGSYPCNKGKCTAGPNGTYTCNCSNTGLFGDKCEKNIIECLQNPCKNNATCIDKWGSYICQCIAGFTGAQCDVDIDDCNGNPCGNRGSCTDKINAFECKCNPGFTGNRCETNIDECKIGKCNITNTNKCVDKINDYYCDCKDGFDGKDCHNNIDECSSNPCQNNGTCVDLTAVHHCICNSGFSGQNCSINIDDCIGKCSNGATCKDGIDEYTCICVAGYTGKDCTKNIDDCSPNPCQHHGNCRDGINDYTCECIPSYIDRNCSTFKDPCKPTNPCRNNASCLVDPIKGFKCNCSSEYDGVLCQHKFGLCYPSPCKHGKCNYTSTNSYNCICDNGYEGKNCSIDTDDCASGPCKNNGVCKDQIGGYKCECPLGFLPPDCASIIYMCPQYKAQNKVDYCINGVCNELGGLQIDCTCRPGYKGKRCQIDINECAFGYCKNNINCIDLVNDYNCTCIPGYTNKNCSLEINECEPNPCQNNATCIDEVNNYKCQCKLGYEGRNCEIDIDWCARLSPCHNGGGCVDGIKTYTCNCLPGFIGRDCDNDINECKPNPCVYQTKNTSYGSVCVEKSNITAMQLYAFSVNTSSYLNRDGYKCVCLPGLKGRNCNVNIEDCNTTTCYNNATCTDLVNDFNCNCLPGFTGKRCQTDINECETNPCRNSGICSDKINDYSCACLPNFEGRTCNTVLTDCSKENPCKNNATACYFDGTSYACSCTTGFAGPTCSSKTNINFNGNGYWKLSGSELRDAVGNRNSFDMLLSFATTLSSGLITRVLFANGSTLDVYMENADVVISISGKKFTSVLAPYNSGKWHTLMIHVNVSGGTIKLDQTASHPSITFTNRVVHGMYVGGIPSKSTVSNYTGCIRDIKINDKTLIPVGVIGDATHGRCGRNNVCFQSSCNRVGKCIDNWTVKKCECFRQYFGDNCESIIEPFSFGEVAVVSKNKTRKRRSVDTNYAYSDLEGTFDVSSPFSFLIRTRQNNGFVAFFINKNSTSNLAIYLKNGKLNFKSFISGVLFQDILPTVVNDGTWHEIILSTVSVKNNGKEFTFTKPLTTFNISRIYLGGVDPNVFRDSTIYSDVIYDGCLQAVKLKETLLTTQIVTSHQTVNMTWMDGIQRGDCPSNNPCTSSPCLYGGNCTDKWFAYECSCAPGFSGKNCASYGCQVINPCPVAADCVDVPSKPGETECPKSFTFNGVNSTATLKLENVHTGILSFDLQTRQDETFLFACYESPTHYFVGGIKNGNLSFHTNFSGKITTLQGGGIVNDGLRHRILIKYSNGKISLTNDNTTQLFPVNFQGIDWLKLLHNRSLVIGLDDSPFIKKMFDGSYFGALIMKQIGEEIPKENQYDSKNVKNGWHSSDPCTSNPCERGRCDDIFNAYRCECPTFYTNNKRCNETIDVSCSFGNICNNGICANLNETTAVSRKYSDHGKDYFQCNCSPGYIGYLCQKVTNECVPNNCENGGICVDLHLQYTCRCADGWTGFNCTSNINDCIPNPCMNKGICEDRTNDYNCKCFEGRYKGKNCTDDVDECTVLVDPCNKKGNCTNNVGGFTCTCESGFYGDKCQYNSTSYCINASPCRHGNCSVVGISYDCTCDKGFTGSHCDTDYKECEVLKPCQNNATCIDSHSPGNKTFIPGYICSCTDRFEGEVCTIEKNPCKTNPCKNGGTCNNVTYDKYKCTCTPAFTGEDCLSSRSVSGNDDETIVIVVCVVVVIIILIIAILLLLCYFKRNSGQQGTYKPNAEEQNGGAVALEQIKKPNVERLI